MPIDWTADPARIDWNELSALYRMAPLGDKAPADLELVFGNSMFRALAFDHEALVGAGRVLADGRDCLATSQCIRRIRDLRLGQEIVARLVRLSEGRKRVILDAVPGGKPFTGGSALVA
jgi:hypothetical protein